MYSFWQISVVYLAADLSILLTLKQAPHEVIVIHFSITYSPSQG